MANLVGRVNFTSSIDGRGMPRDAERIGRQAGRAAGDGYDEEWQKSFRDTLTKAGREAYRRWDSMGRRDGGTYGDSFTRRLRSYLQTAMRNFEGLRLDAGFLDDFARGFGDAEEAAADLQRQLKTLRDENEIHYKSFESARKQVDEWVESQRRASVATREHSDALNLLGRDIKESSNAYLIARADEEDARNRALDALGRELRERSNAHAIEMAEIERSRRAHLEREGTIRRGLDRIQESLSKLNFQWKDLGHNARQWTLIISAVLAAMEELSVLGSAVGAGIIALGGGIAQFGIGAGVAITAMTRLGKDLEELPEHSRRAAVEFKGLRGELTVLADAIAEATFSRMHGAFDRLRSTVSALTPAFEKVGRSAGRVFDEFTRAVAPGTEMFGELNTLIENSASGFEQMSRIAGTLGGALVRSFNRGQPLIQKMYGWIDALVTRFDEFTQSANFDTWIGRADRVFTSFGNLLDEVGRTLNRLVTPASERRTIAFLDNLSRFMPNLERFLNVLGALDIFGLLAQGLADFGEAMEPLGPSAERFMEVFSAAAADVIRGHAAAMGALASAVAPLVLGLANLISAVPPAVMQAFGAALGLAAAGLVAFKVAAAGTAAITFLSNLSFAMGGVTGAAGRLKGALAGMGRAGAIGVAVAGIGALVVASQELKDVWGETESELDALIRGPKGSVAQLQSGMSRLNPITRGLGDAIRMTLNAALGESIDSTDTLRAELDMMSGPLGGVMNLLQSVPAFSFGAVGAVRELSNSYASLAREDLAEAAAKFREFTTEQGLSEAQTMTLIGQMGSFREELVKAAGEMGLATDDQTLLSIAMGESALSAQLTAEQIQTMGVAAARSSEEAEKLREKLMALVTMELDARAAARDFEAAIDDLTDSFKDNSNTLDIGTAAGRTNEAAIDDLIRKTISLAQEIYDETGNQNEANAALERGRQALLDVSGQAGLTEDQISKYIDTLDRVPEFTKTEAQVTGIESAERALNNLARTRTATFNIRSAGGGGRELFAAGGTVYGPTNALIGEAGPEAVVPLRRPLNQVDPSVRWLSAIAQGRSTPMANGGVVGGGRQVTVESGAIVVQASQSPIATSLAVLDRISENID